MSNRLDKLTQEIIVDFNQLIAVENEERHLLSQFRHQKQFELELKCRIGKRLTLVKEIVGHGNFTPWIEASTPMSHRTVNRCMQLYRGTQSEKSPGLANFNSQREALDNFAPAKPRAIPTETDVDERIKSVADYRKQFDQETDDESAAEYYQLSLSPNWLTPPNVLKPVGEFFPELGLDPCCNEGAPNVEAIRHFRKEDDGLKQNWKTESAFVNPPYCREVDRWVTKSLKEFSSKRCKEILLLVPNRTDTQWMKKLDVFARCHIEGRLRFRRELTGMEESSATFPSVLIYLGRDIERFNNCFRTLGTVYVPYLYATIGVRKRDSLKSPEDLGSTAA